MDSSPMPRRMRAWKIALWALFVVFLGTAALNMLKVRGGFLTNHAADLVGPAWLYIALRGLDRGGRRATFLGRTFGATPEMAACTLFLGSTLTELSQRYWPRGLFPGRFDPLDIAAFALGVGVCYGLDRAFPVAPGAPVREVGPS